MQRLQRLNLFRRQLHWKLLFLRFVINSLALLIIAILVPNMYFVDKRLIVLLFAGLMFGILNAIVKPVIQLLTLRFLFASYGLVVVVINALMLGLLGWLFPRTLAIDGVLVALLGGALIGIVSSFLENLFGVNPPMMMLAEQRERGEAGALPDRRGLMGMLISGGAEKTAAAPESPTTEVSDENIDARQGQGEPAPTTSL